MFTPAGGSALDFSALSEVTPDVLDYLAAYDSSGATNAKELIAKLLKADNRHSITIANGTDANHDLDVTWGYLLDSTGAWQFKPGSQTVEDDSTFDGTGNKGRASGASALGANQTNYLFLGAKTDGTQRLFIDTSISAANLPSGYTYFRRLFAFITDGSNNILPGTYTAGTYVYTSQITIVNGAAAPSSAQLDSLTIPTGLRLEVGLISSYQAATTGAFRISDPNTTDHDPDYLSGQNFTHVSVSALHVRHTLRLQTNTAKQVRVRRDTNSTGNYTTVLTDYYDPLVS